ncbi:MAG: 50S ribosomal protein L22 [Candidatus Niyogibacteria bacterium]|nr:50S ribosomal protein L22 [Candidatus Niyogibacteria bacterium]
MAEIKAKLNYLRISPRKVRLAADLMRNQKIRKAIKQLMFLNKRAAQPLKKLLESALANARNNFGIKDESRLYVKEIKVNEGPMLKRFRPRAFGRAAMIRKKTSHISLVLSEQEDNEVKKDNKIYPVRKTRNYVKKKIIGQKSLTKRLSNGI